MKRGASRPPSPTPSIFSALRALPLFRAIMQCAAADPADDAALETLVEHNRYVEPFLCAIVAWNVMVGTLEVNDFRHRLIKAHEAAPCPSYAVALVAVRYGLRDALVDWLFLYSVGYALVGGLTYTDADPNMLIVLVGFSLILSAALLAVTGVRLPQWLGIYHLSALQILQDTSDLAPQAVRELQPTDSEGGFSLASFRYRVRLGVGTHFCQFLIALLPFYAGLRWWAYLLSLTVGLIYGHVVLFLVYVCRQRFKRRRATVALAASFAVVITSAGVFGYGMHVVEQGWKRRVNRDELLLALSFFVWLTCCVVGFCARYYGQQRFTSEFDSDKAHLFEDAVEEIEDGVERAEEDLQEMPTIEHPPTDQEPQNPRTIEKKDSWPHYLGDSVYFDRVKFPREKHTESLHSSIGSASIDVYKEFAAKSDMDTAWHIRLWNFLPARPLWDLFAMRARSTFGCCITDDSYSKKELNIPQKFFFALKKLFLVCLDLLAIYVVIVTCGATVQRKITLEKLWYPEAKNYGPAMNEGPVCAFNEKCGNIQTFASKEDAGSANYTIAHCGACGSCSNWNDFALQPTDLATPANACGKKHLFDGLFAAASCIETDIGFTAECAMAWAKSIDCSKKHCGFIFMQSQITNEVVNFKVGPNTITSATCSEANCEAGNPGNFVEEVGANRRRMNVESEIARPASQQCAIVGIPKNSENYSEWAEFMNPDCN